MYFSRVPIASSSPGWAQFFMSGSGMAPPRVRDVRIGRAGVGVVGAVERAVGVLAGWFGVRR